MMFLLYGLCIYFVTSILCEECDHYGILIYEDLGCTPKFDKNNTCPISYSCQNLGPSNKNCYFKGKAYNDRESVESSLSMLSCDIGCFCNAEGGRASFTCAILDCFEWFDDPINSGCYWSYSLDSCCPVGKICPPFDDAEKCIVDEKEYQIGEQFYPENSCLKCVCQKGFNGKFEHPFCMRPSCGQQLKTGYENEIQKFCAPFYSKKFNGVKLCCPGDWICPDDSEIFKGEAKSEEFCIFGNKTLQVGQYFEKTNIEDGLGRKFEKIKCECVIPPFAKCVEI